MRIPLLAAVVAVATSGLAVAACPEAEDRTDQLRGLIAQARSAPNEAAAQPIGQAMWEIWATAPDQIAQEMLDRGMAARSSYDFLGAIKAFDELVAYCPDYAEGYNQRAFINFLRQDFAPALEDLDRAIARSPLHVAAIAGKGLTLMGLGREEEAQAALKEAVSLNPWLSERHLIKEPLGEEL